MDHSQSRIKFKTTKQFNELAEQGRTSTKGFEDGNSNIHKNTKNNLSSFQTGRGSFSHYFLSEKNNQIPDKQSPQSENQLLMRLQSEISTGIRQLRNEGRLYSSSKIERKSSNFLEEEFSIPHKNKNILKEPIIRRSSCDCGKCGGQCHKLQKLKGIIPQFLPRQVIRDSVKSKLNNAQKTLRRLSMFFRLTNSQSHSHTPNNAAIKQKSTTSQKSPKQEQETKQIPPHKVKIDLKGNLFPQNEGGSGGGRFQARKGSISRIVLHKQGNSNTEIDYIETPQNNGRKSAILSSPHSTSKSSGNNSNKNCTQELREMDTFNQLDQMLSRVDNGFFEELAHQAQDKLDKEQNNFQEHKIHKGRCIDHSQKLESKGIRKSYAKYLTPPHPTLLSILNKPRLPLPHSSSISIVSCRSARQQSSFQGFNPSILDFQQLKRTNYEDSSQLSSERQISESKPTKTAVSLTFIPSSPRPNSQIISQDSTKFKITPPKQQNIQTSSKSQSSKQKRSFNQQASSFSQLQLAKYSESTARPGIRKSLPYLENRFLVSIQQQSSDGISKHTSKKANILSSSAFSVSQQQIKNDGESTDSTPSIFIHKQRLSKQLKQNNSNFSDLNKPGQYYLKCQNSAFLSNIQTDFSDRRKTIGFKSEYFTKNQISAQPKSKPHFTPQQKQYFEQLNSEVNSSSLILLDNPYQSQGLSHLSLTKNQQSSITKKGKTPSIQYFQEDEELRQSGKQEKQKNIKGNNNSSNYSAYIR